MPRKSKPAFLDHPGLVKAVAKRCSQNDIAVDNDTVEGVIDALFQTIYLRLSSKENRKDGDFFKCKLFKATVKERDERLRRNPATGASVAKGATRVVTFSPSDELKARMEKIFRKRPSIGLRKEEAEANGVEWEPPKRGKKKKDAKKDTKKTTKKTTQKGGKKGGKKKKKD